MRSRLGDQILLIIDKSEKNCQIIDVAIQEDGRVRAKEDEKVEKIIIIKSRVSKFLIQTGSNVFNL